MSVWRKCNVTSGNGIHYVVIVRIKVSWNPRDDAIFIPFNWACLNGRWNGYAYDRYPLTFNDKCAQL